MGSVASAGTKIVSGTSTGPAGSNACTGELHYDNSSSPGEDYAYAETASIEAGTKTAKIIIYFGNTYDDAEATGYGYTDAKTVKVYAVDDYQASSATSIHTYNSTQYGTWSKSQTRGL